MFDSSGGKDSKSLNRQRQIPGYVQLYMVVLNGKIHHYFGVISCRNIFHVSMLRVKAPIIIIVIFIATASSPWLNCGPEEVFWHS